MVEYCSPLLGSAKFDIMALMRPSVSLECGRNLRVGDMLMHYARDLRPHHGLVSELLPIDQLLPNLHLKLGLVDPPLPQRLVEISSLDIKPAWMEIRFAIAAFLHGLPWPPWPRPCYSSRPSHCNVDELEAFACDPFNRQILGSWNSFPGVGRIAKIKNNSIENLVGITEPQNPLLRALYDSRLPGEDVVWVNCPAFLAKNKMADAGGDAILIREMSLASLVRPLAIVNGRTGTVDESFARVFASAEDVILRPGALLPVVEAPVSRLASLPLAPPP